MGGGGREAGGGLEEMLLCNFNAGFLGSNYGTVVDESHDEADRIIMINRPQATEYCGNKIRYFAIKVFQRL